MTDNLKRFVVDFEELPEYYPTHMHSPEFWELLGRTIATFGFLEEILGKAIFALTATAQYGEDKISEAYESWLPTLERALIDPLGNLIDVFGKSVRKNSETTISDSDLNKLLEDLRLASKVRNVLSHGSWRPPDDTQKSLPFFVNRQKEVFDTPIGNSFLSQTQLGTTELAMEVVNIVTHMGYTFPGSNGPGKSII